MAAFPEGTKKLEELVAANAFGLVLSILKDLGSAIKNRLDWQQAVSSYASSFLMRYGQIKMLGMPSPVPLHKIYTSVRLLNPSALRKFMSVQDLEAALKSGGERSLSIHGGEESPGFLVANQRPLLNVLGAPGSGKTTFLRRVALEAMMSNPNRKKVEHELRSKTYIHRCLPILFELKQLRDSSSINLEELLAAELSVCGFPKPREFLDSGLQRGSFLILLDGLDEVPHDALDEVIQSISSFVVKYRKNRFITSCRTAFYKSYFQSFTDVELADFNHGQIREFVFNWFSEGKEKDTSTAKRFLRILKAPYNASTLELSRSPLLLTFLCLVYSATQRFPKYRFNLYDKALHILLEEWAAQKRVHNDPVYEDLNTELEITMLSEIAGPAFVTDQVFFTRRELLGKIRNFMKNQVNAPRTLNSKQILEAIEIQQGVIVERAHDVYSFSHLTVQEFLAAYYFWENWAELRTMIRTHFSERRWREIFLLLCGADKKGTVLSLLANRVQLLTDQSRKMAQVVRWCESVEESWAGHLANEERRLAVRCCAMLAALSQLIGLASQRERRYFTYDIIGLANMSLSLYPDLKTDVVAVVNQSKLLLGHYLSGEGLRKLESAIGKVMREKRLGLYEHIMECLREAKKTGKEWHVINGEQIASMGAYIYATKLVYDCKESAEILPKKKWREISGKLIRLPSPHH